MIHMRLKQSSPFVRWVLKSRYEPAFHICFVHGKYVVCQLLNECVMNLRKYEIEERLNQILYQISRPLFESNDLPLQYYAMPIPSPCGIISTVIIFVRSTELYCSSFNRFFFASSGSSPLLGLILFLASAFSFPFLTWMLHPCNFSARVKALLGLIPGKSFAVYTVNTSDKTSVRIGEYPPTCRWAGSIRIKMNRNRYFPCVRQLRSGKQKKHPSTSCSSFATLGLATNWPISRLVARLSGWTKAVSSPVPSAFQRVQCTTFSE